jgi:hypothetical protein
VKRLLAILLVSCAACDAPPPESAAEMMMRPEMLGVLYADDDPRSGVKAPPPQGSECWGRVWLFRGMTKNSRGDDVPTQDDFCIADDDRDGAPVRVVQRIPATTYLPEWCGVESLENPRAFEGVAWVACVKLKDTKWRNVPKTTESMDH